MRRMPAAPRRPRPLHRRRRPSPARRALRGGRVGRRPARGGARRGAAAGRQRRPDRPLERGARGRRRLARPGAAAALRRRGRDLRSSCGSPTPRSASCATAPQARPTPAIARMVTTLLALELERSRAPEWASEEVASAFVAAVLAPRGDRPRRHRRPRRRARRRPRPRRRRADAARRPARRPGPASGASGPRPWRCGPCARWRPARWRRPRTARTRPPTSP